MIFSSISEFLLCTNWQKKEFPEVLILSSEIGKNHMRASLDQFIALLDKKTLAQLPDKLELFFEKFCCYIVHA